MTIGPDPMSRIVEMSVRFGISARPSAPVPVVGRPCWTLPISSANSSNR